MSFIICNKPFYKNLLDIIFKEKKKKRRTKRGKERKQSDNFDRIVQ